MADLFGAFLECTADPHAEPLFSMIVTASEASVNRAEIYKDGDRWYNCRKKKCCSKVMAGR
jgi:hypothetical protein